MAEFRMPTLGADMTEGTLVEWLVAPGETVHHGQIVAVIDTVKSAIDIEVFEDGVVDRLLVEPGTTVSVGTPLALIAVSAAGGEVAPPPEPVAPPVAAPVPVVQPAPSSGDGHRATASPVLRHLAHDLHVDLSAVEGTGPDGAVTRHDVERAAAARATPAPAAMRAGGHVAASPRARRLAVELGVDLAAVTGSGPRGTVTVADVEAAAASPVTAAPAAPAPAPAPTPPAARPRTRAADVRTDARHEAMQAATAALMARSKREIPHYYLQTTIDLKASLDWLASRNQGRAPSERLLPAALLLKATAASLLTVPELNGFYVDDRFEPHAHVDLGVAVSLRAGGLLVASLRDADTLTVEDLMGRLKDVATRARAGRLTGSEMSVPTVTVTNLGDQGADLVQGVIYPPQVALVGFGRVVERPWAVDGMLAVRPVVVATLAADHRVSDGHRGSRFLAALDAALQKPEEL